MTTTMDEFEDLFALGGQYLCDDFATGMISVPVSSYGNGPISIPTMGGRRQQQPCLSLAEKKRQERNAREKERSFRITKQIEDLKELLMSSGIKIKKQSKFAILTGAAEYLQQLQKQSLQLSKDLDKVVQDSNHDRVRCLEIEQAAENERLSFFLKGEDAALHAKKTFYSAPVPLAIVGIDGKFLEMNAMFVKITRLPMEYLQHISLFKLIQPSCLHDCYSKIAEMLLPVQMSMDGTMLCRPHHTHQNNVFFDRPMGRTGCSQICLPGDRLLVRSIVHCGGVDAIERINACSFVNTIPMYHVPMPIHPNPTHVLTTDDDMSHEKSMTESKHGNIQNNRSTSSSSSSSSSSSPSLSLPSSPSPISIANGLFNVSSKMTDFDSKDSLSSMAAPTSNNHGSLRGDCNHNSSRDSPKPLKKRPVTQSPTTTNGIELDTDVEDNSSSEETKKVANSMSVQGKKRPHQFMSITSDDVHGEPGYFTVSLVRDANMEPRYFSVAFITAEEIPYD